MLEHPDAIIGIAWPAGNENLIHTATLDDTRTLIELNTWNVSSGERMRIPRNYPQISSPYVTSIALCVNMSETTLPEKLV